MPHGGDIVISVSITAKRAGIYSISRDLFGRRNYLGLIAVPEARNRLHFLMRTVALACVGFYARRGAGRLARHDAFVPVVFQCGNSLLRRYNRITPRAMAALCFAADRTSRRNGGVYNRVVFRRVYRYRFGFRVRTVTFAGIGFFARRGAGRLARHDAFVPVVFQCGNSLLRRYNRITPRAMTALCFAVRRTTWRYGGVGYRVVCIGVNGNDFGFRMRAVFQTGISNRALNRAGRRRRNNAAVPGMRVCACGDFFGTGLSAFAASTRPLARGRVRCGRGRLPFAVFMVASRNCA